MEMCWYFVASFSTCFLATLGFCLKSRCGFKIHRAVEMDVEMPFSPMRKPSLDDTIHGNKR
jgi:hypothetical protein